MSKTLGIVFIVAGLVIAIWGGFGFQTREKVLDIGPIEATKTTKHEVPYAPILGGLILVGGVVVLVSSKR